MRSLLLTLSSDECGKQRFVQEDPDERAARLALELTPWGVCNGCHSTIMMSDEVCLICNLPRGAPKPERLSRGSRSSADSLRGSSALPAPFGV